jgi:hypothetical protein
VFVRQWHESATQYSPGLQVEMLLQTHSPPAEHVGEGLLAVASQSLPPAQAHTPPMQCRLEPR